MTPAFYSEKQLTEMGLGSVMTRWRMRQREEFPEPVSLSPGRKGYPANQIDEWIKERMGVASDAA